MTALLLNRFEWLKAVLQSEDLNAAAKAAASALAVQFANGETGQLNPSVLTLANYLKTSSDTVKRAIRALVAAGWLSRTEGRGRGNSTRYTLRSPGSAKVVENGAEVCAVKGSTVAPSGKRKGAMLHGKGRRPALSYNKEEQSYEQKDRRSASTGSARPSFPVQFVEAGDKAKVIEWNSWLETEGLPSLQQLSSLHRRTSCGSGYLLPRKWVPSEEDGRTMARGYIQWVMEQQNFQASAH